MSEMRERMHQLVDEYERLGEGKSIAEQELLVIEFGKQIQRLMMQEMVEKGERGTGSGEEGKGVKKKRAEDAERS
jgi:hypothetical protein